MGERRCSVEGCARSARTREYCGLHYARFLRHGSPLVRKKAGNGELMAWLRDHADYKRSDCLVWPYGRGADGRAATVRWKGRTRMAQRVMCELAHGPAPFPKADSRHLCGRGHKGCLNPQHLVWSTRKQNLADKLVHGTHNRGERNSGAKLTVAQVEAIRADARSGKTIAEVYGVSQSRVSAIRKGRTWAWLNGDLPEKRSEKLSQADVRAIRTDTRRQAAIAADYDISRPLVSAIKLRRAWAWLD